MLASKWEETDAFKLGIIDAKGNFLKKTGDLTNAEERKAFTKFHVLVFNLKKLIEKLPFGSMRLASLATALYLLKEEVGDTGKDVESLIWNFIKDNGYKPNNLHEHFCLVETIDKGEYIVIRDIITDDGALFKKGEKIIVSNPKPIDKVLGNEVFTGKSKKNKQTVIFVAKDVEKVK